MTAWPSSAARYPGPKGSIAGFAVTTGATDGVLVALNDPLQMYVVEGIDVTATASGTGTEFFTIDMWQGGGTVFMGTIFGNQVSPPTGLNFAWRGLFPVYVNQQIRLHSVSGGWSASMFGFSTAADNVAH